MKILDLRRSVLFIFLLLITSLISAQMRQVYVDLVNNNEEIKKISFFSPNEGYIATYGSTTWVGYTSDTGHSFIRKPITWFNVDYGMYNVNLTFGFEIKGVKAISRDTIIVYGDYGFVPSILYSIDGGNSFTVVYYSSFTPLQFSRGITDMIFPQNGNVGYAVDDDRILKTIDKGRSWTTVRIDANSKFDFLESADNNNVIAFSSAGPGSPANKLLKTTNGGSTWQQLAIPQGKILYSTIVSQSKLWLNMSDDNKGNFYYSVNGGSSWTQKNDGDITPFNFEKFKFVNDSTGYAIKYPYATYKTTDSGKIWQQLPRDNNFEYLGYSHNDLLVWNESQLIAGGAKAFVELSNNGGGRPIAKAFFKVDTNQLYLTNTVNLINYSKPGYQYKWFLNNNQISTSYHATYLHTANQLLDTVKLVVIDGSHSDTLLRDVYFNPPVTLTSFSPNEAVTGSTIIIRGTNLSSATQVSFGGVNASSFSIVSPTQINAVVANGASGSVVVNTTIGAASLNGFIYFPPPTIDLPYNVSKNILCKSESINITIQNTQVNVSYEFLDSLNQSYGSVAGNGGTASFSTTSITRTGNYRIRATRVNFNSENTFTNKIFILVEHTKSAFTSNRINVFPNEGVHYYQHSRDAQKFYWAFDTDASRISSNQPDPQNISYTTGGQKNVSLISESLNGCKDTINNSSVFVIHKPVPDDVCYVANMGPTTSHGHGLVHLTKAHDNGFIISGHSTEAGFVRSRYGISKNLDYPNSNYLAKFTTDGALQWMSYFINGQGRFGGSAVDETGNIYVVGTAVSTRYLHLNDHDSIRMYAVPSDTTFLGERSIGFILKLDPNGKYMWHSIIYDYSPSQAAEGSKIVIKNNHIVLIGNFGPKLSYWHNGVMKHLYDFLYTGYPGDNQNHFIFKINNDGSLIWNAYLSQSAINFHKLADVDIDNTGSSYLTGTYEGSLKAYDKDSIETVTLNGNVGYFRGFLIKFDPFGKMKWANTFSNNQYGDVRMNAVAVDEFGNSFVTGNGVHKTLPYQIQIANSNGINSYDSIGGMLIFKFDSSGQLIWGVGNQNHYSSEGNAIHINGNQVYVLGTGSQYGANNLPFVFTSTNHQNQNIQINGSEFFVANYETNGILKRITRSGMNDGGYVYPSKIYIDDANNFMIVGNADIYMDNGDPSIFGMPLQMHWTGDGFYTKLKSDYCLSTAAPIANAGPDTLICSGDSIRIGIPSETGNNYYWTDYPGNFVSILSDPIVSPTSTTTYYLTVVNPAGISTRDSVVILVTGSLAPLITISANTIFTTGQTVHITSAIVYAGSSPAYQWQDSTQTRSWQNINNANQSTLDYIPSASGNKLRCILTSSQLCVMPGNDTSNVLTFTMNNVTAINPLPVDNYGIRHFPNPVSSMFTIENLKLSDNWQTVSILSISGNEISQRNIAGQTKLEIDVKHLSSGTYIAMLKNKKGTSAFLKFIKF